MSMLSYNYLFLVMKKEEKTTGTCECSRKKVGESSFCVSRIRANLNDGIDAFGCRNYGIQ